MLKQFSRIVFVLLVLPHLLIEFFELGVQVLVDGLIALYLLLQFVVLLVNLLKNVELSDKDVRNLLLVLLHYILLVLESIGHLVGHELAHLIILNKPGLRLKTLHGSSILIHIEYRIVSERLILVLVSEKASLCRLICKHLSKEL